MEHDSEFLLLNSINELTRQKADISQRDLARGINLSLGMTNVLLKRLSLKGYILIQKVSARNVSYMLTPEGINELAGRTYRYLKRTMKKVVNYKETIISIVQDARNRGFTFVCLLGRSDIDFIIEYAARNSGLHFQVFLDGKEIPEDSFVFVSENYDGPDNFSQKMVAHIGKLLKGEP
jgi:DNA-binding MarR family transcriptional regulator